MALVSHKKRVGPFPGGPASLMQDGRIVGNARPAGEGTWVQGWWIEIPYKYNLYIKTEGKYQKHTE